MEWKKPNCTLDIPCVVQQKRTKQGREKKTRRAEKRCCTDFEIRIFIRNIARIFGNCDKTVLQEPSARKPEREKIDPWQGNPSKISVRVCVFSEKSSKNLLLLRKPKCSTPQVFEILKLKQCSIDSQQFHILLVKWRRGGLSCQFQKLFTYASIYWIQEHVRNHLGLRYFISTRICACMT